MDATVLMLHSLLRWVVLATGALTVLRSVWGLTTRRPWTPMDDKATLWFTIALDVQLLVGLSLYLLFSPTIRLAMQNMGTMMSNASLRFFAVEHVTGMVVAIVLAHLGRVLIRKANSNARHRRAVIFLGLALLIILASIPWPGTPNARPLLPF